MKTTEYDLIIIGTQSFDFTNELPVNHPFFKYSIIY